MVFPIQDVEFIVSLRLTKTICCVNERLRRHGGAQTLLGPKHFFSLVLHLSNLADADNQIYKYKYIVLF